MKKSLLLMLFLALTWAWTGVNAQEQLTVYDGTATNSYVPAYMSYFDDFTRTQTVIPASDLEDMAGGTISAIKFYTTDQNVPYTTVSTVDVYVKEVTSSSISAFEDKANCTMVYQGTLDIVAEGTGGALSITFSAPFAYKGGNLLIGIENTTDAGYKFIYFYGQTVTGASVGGYNSSSLDNVNPSQRNFIPKTTFTYELASTGCDMPTSITVSAITDNSATISWESEGSAFNLRYKASDEADFTLVENVTSPYSLTNLDGNKSYSVGVQNVCSSATSNFKSTSFETANPCAAPKNLVVSNITASSATLSWTAGYQEAAWTVKYKKSSATEWTESPVTVPTIDLSSLEGLTQYNVQIINCSEDANSKLEGSFFTGASFPFNEAFNASSIPTGWAQYTGLLSDVMSGTALTSTTYAWAFGSNNGVFDSHARVNIYGNYQKWLVTPAIPMQAGAQLTFDLALTAFSGNLAAPATSGTDDKFVVLLSADNGATWKILRQWDNAGSDDVFNNIPNTAAGQQVAIDLSSYNGQNICIAFYGESTVSNADNNLHIDNVRIDYIPDCAIPTTLAVSEITAHTAQLSWTDESASEWVIAYKKAADTDFTEIEGVTENPYTLEGLVGETAYEVKIKANCGDAQSEFTASKNFTTLIACQKPTALAAQLTQGDGSIATLSWTAGAEESDWVLQYGQDANFAENSYEEENVSGEASIDLSGLTPEATYYARVKAVCGGEDGESAWSTVISFTPTDAYVLTVNDGTSTNSYVPIYGLYVDNISKSKFIIPAADLAAIQWGVINKLTFYSSTATAAWTNAKFEVYMAEVNETTLSALGDYTSMEKVMDEAHLEISGNKLEVTLSAPFQYMGGNLMIGFLQTVSGTYTSASFLGVEATGASFGGYGTSVNQQNFLPKVSFDYTPGEEPQCVKPTGLAVEYNGGTEATISWTSDASSFNMKVNGTPIDAAINSPSYVLGGLELATTYSIEVQANCGTATSDWTSPISFTTDACLNPFVVNYDLADSYGDGWNGGAAILVSDGEQTIETLTLASGSSKTGSLKLCGEYYEFIWHKGGTYDYEASFELTDGNNDPLYSTDDASGLTEGQVLFTLGHLSCAKPEMVDEDIESGSSSAQLIWIERGDATAWKVAYKKVADEEFTEIDVDANPFVLDGLDAETNYVFKVRPICDDEAIKWSAEKQFSTQANCPTPFNLHVVGAIPYNDTIAWTGSTDVQNYNVEYREAASREFIDESFESGALPAGWTIEGNGTWSVGTGDYSSSTGAHSGSYNAKINHGTTGDVTYLVTPEMDFSSESALSLGLWYINRSWAGDNDGFGVCYRVNGGEWNELFATTDAHSTWTELNQALPAGALVANCQIGFRFTDAYGYGVGLDDITLGDLQPAGEWQPKDPVSETSIALSGLTPLKKYDVRVKSECAGDEGWSDILSFVAEAKEYVTITAAGYATYYNSFAYVMPAGVEGYAFSSALQLSKAFDPTDVVAYETPLVLKGAPGKYEIVPAATAGAQAGDNLLTGVHTETWVSDETGYKFYVLSLAKPEGDADPDPSTVGFYWYKSDGSGGFSLPAKKAYLKLDASDANNAPGFIFDENGATSLDNLKGVEGTLKFIQDGTIYILRKGVIYDATGRKVRELK